MEKKEKQQPEQRTDEVEKMLKQAKDMVDGDHEKGLIAIYHDGENVITCIIGKHITLASMLANAILSDDGFNKVLKAAVFLLKMHKTGIFDDLEKGDE